MEVYGSWSTWPRAAQGLGGRLPRDAVAYLADVYAFAARWHGDQRRPAGEPYVEHLLETVEILAMGAGAEDREVLSVGLLHDVVEDTPCTLGEVESRFGARVADFVCCVTKPDPRPGQDQAAVRRAYLQGFTQAPDEVVLIKLADRYSNVQRLHTHPRPEKRRSYYAETRQYFVPLATRFPYFDGLFTAWEDHYRFLADQIE